jgi:hypothetical protein
MLAVKAELEGLSWSSVCLQTLSVSRLQHMTTVRWKVNGGNILLTKASKCSFSKMRCATICEQKDLFLAAESLSIAGNSKQFSLYLATAHHPCSPLAIPRYRMYYSCRFWTPDSGVGVAVLEDGLPTPTPDSWRLPSKTVPLGSCLRPWHFRRFVIRSFRARDIVPTFVAVEPYFRFKEGMWRGVLQCI